MDEVAPVKSPAKSASPLRIIFFIVLMDLMGFGIIIPLLPLFASEYRASTLEVGLLFSIYSACQFIASPILGVISDRYGRRPVLVFSQFGSAVGYLLLGIVMQLHWTHVGFALALIYVSRLIDGLSGGNISTAQAYISDVTPPEQRARGMGVLGAAFGIGFAIGPALGGFLSWIYPPLPGYAAAAMSTAAMIRTYLLLPESRVHIPAAATDWFHPRRFIPIFRNRVRANLLFISFVIMLGFMMLQSMVSLFLNDKRTFSYRDWQVALYFAYLGVIIATVQGGLVGRLTKRFGEWRLATIGPILVAAGMGLLALTSFWPLLAILLIGGAINAAGRSLQMPAIFALLSLHSDPREQGLVYGLNQGMSSIAQILGPLIAAAAFQLWIGGPFVVGAAIALAVAVWTAAIRRPAKEVPAADQAALTIAEAE